MKKNNDLAIINKKPRKESFLRKVARALMAVTPKSVILEVLEIAKIPKISKHQQQRQDQTPKPWTNFRSRMHSYDGVVFVSPDHGQPEFDSEDGVVISISVGLAESINPMNRAVQSLVFLNVPTMQKPETYLGQSAQLFETNDNLSNERSANFLKDFMTNFLKQEMKTKAVVI
ncbi:MAG: NAD(P)H-dependent oxidoreductase [Bdellovibrio sp.]|nr:NAD(P)H-dependent oxidoreductase [Bdellovibrio sp.]